MSKAKQWVKSYLERIEVPHICVNQECEQEHIHFAAQTIEGSDEPCCCVNFDNNRGRIYADFSQADAVRLGHWLLDTFGEEGAKA